MNPAPLADTAGIGLRRRGTAVLALAVLLVGLAACGGGASGTPAADTAAQGAQGDAGSGGGASGGSGSGSEEGSEDAAQPTVKIGEPVTEPRKFELTVVSVTSAKRVDGRPGEKETPDGGWVMVELTAKNIADFERSLLISDQKYLAEDGTEYPPKRAIYPETDAKEGFQDLNAGETGSAVLAYDVPVGTKLEKLELHGTALTDGVVVTAPHTVE